MTGRIAFSVPGEPRGKDRPRASGRVVWEDGRARALVTVHSDADMVRREKAVLDEFLLRHRGHQPFVGPVMLQFTAIFETPTGWPKPLREAAQRGQIYHTSVPDKDNIEKLIVDALNGWAFVDDAQVQGGGVKRYGSPARVDIILTPLDHPAGLPTAPAQQRREERLERDGPGPRPKARGAKRTKANMNPRLKAAVDKALDKERGR